jgi:capsular polysaccharide biosynthesis protein
MLANGWLVILCATLLSAVAVECAQRYLRDPVYSASAQLFAVVPGDAGVYAAFEGNRAATIRMDTYTQLATSVLVTSRTIDDLQLNITPAELAENVTAAPIPGDRSLVTFPMSALLRIEVTGDDPETTVRTVNSLAKNMAAASQEIEWTESGPRSPVPWVGPGAELVLVDAAMTADEDRPSLIRNLALGGALGLAISCLGVLILGIARGAVLNRAQLDYVATQTISGEVPWNVR